MVKQGLELIVNIMFTNAALLLLFPYQWKIASDQHLAPTNAIEMIQPQDSQPVHVT